jgi:hypothetical protein
MLGIFLMRRYDLLFASVHNAFGMCPVGNRKYGSRFSVFSSRCEWVRALSVINILMLCLNVSD